MIISRAADRGPARASWQRAGRRRAAPRPTVNRLWYYADGNPAMAARYRIRRPSHPMARSNAAAMCR